MNSDFLVLDMFSGGGGLTEGFIRRSFDFVGHIEMDRNAADTLETRLLIINSMQQGKIIFINNTIAEISDAKNYFTQPKIQGLTFLGSSIRNCLPQQIIRSFRI